MKVLIACEESQTVCKAFRRLGHEAYSCDLVTCSGGHPEWHIMGMDALVLLRTPIAFHTDDGVYHHIDKWDMMIAHPPCTYLSKAGANWLIRDGKINLFRLKKALAAREFFLKLFDCEIENVAIENPTPLKLYRLPPYTQAIQPYQFGEPYTKRTCLWLKNLPELKTTKIVRPLGSWTDKHRSARVRSKTFDGIANAMAEQWGRL